MKVVAFKAVLVICFFLTGFNPSAFAQCSLVDNTQGALFITYERTAKVKTDGEKVKDGVILRLHNNSTCDVIVTTGSDGKFYKPLPPNPTIMQRVNREIDYDLPDGALVPDVQYAYQTGNGYSRSVLGDMFFGFNLVGTRSILFEVPFEHIGISDSSHINLSFQWTWELKSQGKVKYSGIESIVKFWTAALPKEVKRKLKKS